MTTPRTELAPSRRDGDNGPEGGTPRPHGLDARMRRSIVAVALVGVAMTVVTFPVFGLFTAFSVATGAAIATANLWILARIVSALLPDESAAHKAKDGKGGWALLALLKLFGLVAAVWLLMRHGVVSPLPLMVGFGALPIGIAIGALVSDRSAASKEED